MKKIAIIGSGFSGLSSAAYLAAKGYEVDVFEKNDQLGGRARQFSDQGFLFDMGPSWYWMPEVFEKFYADFNHSSKDFYKLIQLSPSFRVFFSKEEKIDVPSDFEELCQLFESIEKGSAAQLKKFMKEAAYKYEVGINKLVYKPGLSIKEFMDKDFLMGMLRLQVFSSFSKHVKDHFKDQRLQSLMEFPVLFLGASPEDTPALYSLMNYAGLQLGTWYPMGGFYKVVDAMMEIGAAQGVNYHVNSEVQSLQVENGKITHIQTAAKTHKADAVIGAADYHHIEQKLLSKNHRVYDEKYWNSRVLAPSALIFYLGINKKVKNLIHHNLFFDADFKVHSEEIYKSVQWPTNPLFYVCCPSKTDPNVAPEGKENLFILIPLAPGLVDTEELREKYYTLIMKRLEAITGESIANEVLYKRDYCVKDFVKDYNSLKGNAYGLANTLFQTALFKPSLRSKKISNLFYAGQLTVPGPGVPPSIISGKLAADQLMKQF